MGYDIDCVSRCECGAEMPSPEYRKWGKCNKCRVKDNVRFALGLLEGNTVLHQGEIVALRIVTDLAARLDEAEKRITELELATPCPMLKSICEDWEYTEKAKPSPDKGEIVERYEARIWEDYKCNMLPESLTTILSDFYEEVKHGT